ncbi:hypothetical protein ACIPW5_38560 [Streptomyces sp. NPDC090077]|uniref:hypothetical protein n=1 Tax=Streptomyces sp. NPDC090077 TaxID=3365938 RepID=UPI00380DFDD3
MGGRSSVWLCVGQARIRADRLVAVEPSEGGLALRFTGMREHLRLALPDPEPDPTGLGSGHADRLLSAIAYAAEHGAATLITYEEGDEYFLSGFTARTLTGDDRVLALRLREPAPTLAELTARLPADRRPPPDLTRYDPLLRRPGGTGPS